MRKSTPSLLLFMLLTLSAVTPPARADILDAIQDYEEQRHEAAFSQFKQLATLGSDRARYHLALMYQHGLGVEADPLQAHAWAQLLDPDKDADVLTLQQSIWSALTEAQHEEAKAAAEALRQSMGDDPILSRLAPIRITDANADEEDHSQDYQLTIIERAAPVYPRAEYRSGTQGWVRVGFDVYPDGSVRHPYVIESVPSGVFDEVTLDAIAGFRFKMTFNEGVEPHPIHAKQMIQFILPNDQSDESLADIYQQRLDTLRQQADAGHPDAQYYYALAASSRSLIKDHVNLSAESVNDWLLKAAQNGQLDAQYQLGYNIFYGSGCQADKQRGVNWLTLAAENGHPKAARQAHRLLQRFALDNASEQPSEYWLRKAAESGDVEAKLDYAAHLVQAPALTAEQGSLVSQLLKEYRKERDPTVTYHQVLARYHNLMGDDKKAAKAHKKATRLAGKLGWDLSI